VELGTDGFSGTYVGEASVWGHTNAGNWNRISRKSFPTTISSFGHYRVSFGLDLDDLTLGPDGQIWIGGGSFAHSMA
jgi:hypothetical protein